MNETDRLVRAGAYDLFISGSNLVDASRLAGHLALGASEVRAALERLSAQKRLVVDGDRVMMAHPFAGVETGYVAVIDDQRWNANCAWDALGILAMLGEGQARCPGGPVWKVYDGTVDPEGLVHFLVPARHFWDDVAFT